MRLHFSSVGFTTTINLAKAPATNNAMHAEVVRCQLNANELKKETVKFAKTAAREFDKADDTDEIFFTTQ